MNTKVIATISTLMLIVCAKFFFIDHDWRMAFIQGVLGLITAALAVYQFRLEHHHGSR